MADDIFTGRGQLSGLPGGWGSDTSLRGTALVTAGADGGRSDIADVDENELTGGAAATGPCARAGIDASSDWYPGGNTGHDGGRYAADTGGGTAVA